MVPNNFDTKMLIILPTKEIKVFHSSSQVGIAYMLFTALERKNRNIFSSGYFSCRTPGNLEISRKIAKSIQFRLSAPMNSTFAPPDVFLFFLRRKIIGHQRAVVRRIANFAVLPNADRKR